MVENRFSSAQHTRSRQYKLTTSADKILFTHFVTQFTISRHLRINPDCLILNIAIYHLAGGGVEVTIFFD